MDCSQVLGIRQVDRSRSLASRQSRSLKSVASVRTKSVKSEASVRTKSVMSEASVRSESYQSEASALSVQATAHTTNPVTTENTNKNNVALVGGAVGGALGATLLVLIGVLLWRRKRNAPIPPPACQQPFLGQQPSASSASPTFSTNTGYLSGPLVTHSAQYGWGFQQSSSSALSEGVGSPVVGRMSTASYQSASPPRAVNTWIERPSTIHQENNGGPTPQSQASLLSPAEGPVDPRQLYSDALQGSTYSAVAPVNVPCSASGTSGSPPPPAAAYPDMSRTGRF